MIYAKSGSVFKEFLVRFALLVFISCSLTSKIRHDLAPILSDIPTEYGAPRNLSDLTGRTLTFSVFNGTANGQKGAVFSAVLQGKKCLF